MNIDNPKKFWYLLYSESRSDNKPLVRQTEKRYYSVNEVINNRNKKKKINLSWRLLEGKQEIELTVEKLTYEPPKEAKKTLDVIFASNYPRGAEAQEIINNTIQLYKGLSKDKRLLYRNELFFRISETYHRATRLFKQYETWLDLDASNGKPIKIQTVPVFDEPNLDRVSRRYIERADRELQREKAKETVISNKINSSLLEILKAQGLTIEQIKKMK